MLCDKCKKNEATVHIKEIHNGVGKTIHLCHECARQKDGDSPLGGLDGLGVNLAEVLFNIEKFAQSVKSGSDAPAGQEEELACPQCHWTASMIKTSGGKLGCPRCYQTFKEIVADAVAQVQKGPVHLGKHPGKDTPGSPARIDAELRRLQSELKKLVSGEEYEAAALCRDRINALREQLARSGEK